MSQESVDLSPWSALLESAAKFSGSALNDMSLPNPPDKNLLRGEAEKALGFEVSDVVFSVFGEVAISAFNAASDKDADGILGTTSVEDNELAIGPLIEFQPDKAWLKYDFEAGIKANVELGDAFDFKAEGGVRHTTYLRHEPTETVLQAIKTDLAARPFIFSANDMLSLKPGEGVALLAHGKLQAKLEFKWSDLLTAGMTALGRLLPVPGEAFAIQLGASASAKLDLSVTDLFQLVLVRVTEGVFRVAVRKAEGERLAVAVTAAVTAKFSDEKAVNKALQQVIDGLLGAPLSSVREVLDEVSQLRDLELRKKLLVDQVIQRLGLEDVVEDAATLRSEIEAFEKKVAQKLKDIATKKAELSFAYDYRRLASEEQVLVVRLDKDVLSRYHGDLVRGRLNRLLEDAENPKEVAVDLERFLFQKSLKVERSWGFSLSFGKRLRLSGRGTKELGNVKRRNAKGEIQRTFLGSRGYTAKWFEDELSWEVDFVAEMRKYAKPPVKANQFHYSLHLQVENAQSKIREWDLEASVDRAAIWGVIPVGQIATEVSRLGAFVVGQRNVTFTYQLRIDEVAFKAIRSGIATRDATAFGRALAEAMWWRDNLRRNPTNRRRLYGPLWQEYLEDESMTPERLARVASASFDAADFRELAFQERKWRERRSRDNLGATIGGLAQLNKGTRDEWNDFVVGAGILDAAIRESAPYEEIKNAFNKMCGLWGQSYHMWALGVYLRELVDRRPELGQHIERFLTVEFKNRNGRKVIEHIGTSRPLRGEAEDDR